MKTHILSRWEAAVVFLAFVLHATAFTLYTGQIWEDYFITFTFSQHLAEGKGLTHNGVDRVHGFTSPLGTLLPALFHWLAGATTYEPALLAYRVISALAYATAGTSAFVFLAQRHPAGRWVGWLLVSFLLADAKSVAFSTNGMETGWMVLFVALGFILTQLRFPRSWLPAGVVWAGLLWTRPDGCVYIAVFALLQLLQRDGTPRARITAIVQQSLVAAVLYLPWFVFAWTYFGSPVPHTMIAKSMYTQINLHMLGNEPMERITSTLAEVFAPIGWCIGHGDWPSGLRVALVSITAFAALLWVVPFQDRIGRSASFATLCLLGYYLLAPGCSWYFPPVALLALIALACFAATLFSQTPVWFGRPLAIALVLGILGLQSFITWHTFGQSRLQQEYIEWGNRKNIADTLRKLARPNDTVFLECLGYIGYFSGCEMLDYPGLVSPRVVEARRSQLYDNPAMHSYIYCLSKLQPDWLVARPAEIRAIEKEYPEFQERYHPVAYFDRYLEIEKRRPFPGSDWLLFDSQFVLFQRQPMDAKAVESQ